MKTEGIPSRITSIDALRGLVMFTMIFVNDLAGAPENIVPDWMVHFSDRHHGGSGMTFVDLVFPGFLFIVGMSIPFALGARLAKGEAVWKIIFHVVVRTLSLLLLGILMVNESPNAKMLGWPATWWVALMYLSAMLAFCGISAPKSFAASPGKIKFWRGLNWALRGIGFAMLLWLALVFRNKHGQAILTLSPFHIRHSWYGILGLIGWAYLVGALAFLFFRANRTALLGGIVLLFCLYPADKNGLFDNFWLSHIVGIGESLGAHPAITTAGVLLATILLAADTTTVALRTRFAGFFIATCASAALLLNGLYGISKNDATPSWCLWSCAVTAALWLVFYFLCDVRRVTFISKPLAVAGQNVLLAYLISEGMESFLDVLHLGDWYGQLAEPNLFCACARSAGLGVAILALTALLNRLGFRLKL
jgi:predicted acyltransferase